MIKGLFHVAKLREINKVEQANFCQAFGRKLPNALAVLEDFSENIVPLLWNWHAFLRRFYRNDLF